MGRSPILQVSMIHASLLCTTYALVYNHVHVTPFSSHRGVWATVLNFDGGRVCSDLLPTSHMLSYLFLL
jgi:hypothetical protein